MNTEQIITAKLTKALNPFFLSVENESHAHNVGPNAQTHFKIILASDKFDGMSLVGRHRQIYEVLSEELAGELHALAMHLFTEAEWERNPRDLTSPNCMGGSKK